MSDAVPHLARPDSELTPNQEFERAIAEFCDSRKLTPREKQIVLLLCTGLKNAAVATHLGVSEATVRLHITNIHRKLETASKVDVLIQAFQWWIARSRTNRPSA